MEREKIHALANKYAELWPQIKPKRIDPKLAFSRYTSIGLMAHIKYLAINLREYALDPEKYGKANRHLGAIQTLLSVVGWYTLEELMDHNRPDPDELSTYKE